MTFPFAAIVGNASAKRALMLLAVDRKLRGVLLSSSAGAAKSVLVRAAKSLFQLQAPADTCSTPFVELPVGATAESLSGGLDFERTLQSGEKRFTGGLLEQANDGVLVADDINLLDIHIVAQLAAALDTRRTPAQGDGLKMATGADFVLIASQREEASESRSLLGTRVAMMVELATVPSPDERAEIIQRVSDYERDAASFSQRFADEMQALRCAIIEAQHRLPLVAISEDDLRRLSLTALAAGIEGHQVDVFAVRVAKANAALDGRIAVNEDDLLTAIQLVVLPRAMKMPVAMDHQTPTDSQTQPGDYQNPNESNSASPQNDMMNASSPFERERGQGKAISPDAIEELLIKAMDAYLTTDMLKDQFARRLKRNQTTGGKAKSKQNSDLSANHNRGRVIRTSNQPTAGRPIAVAATLRAAAPFQNLRQKQESSAQKRVRIVADDLRYKRFRHKRGRLFIFAVDASGSMAVNRMAQAKGAMTRLLQQAYIHRDEVALISFRQREADLLLPPTRSVERARRLVDGLPVGGATPLASALVKAKALVERQPSQKFSQTLVALFTDGRANIALHPQPSGVHGATRQLIESELQQIGVLFQQAKIHLVVIDTKAKFLAGGDARALAEILGADYLYLPRASDQTIYQAVNQLANQQREGKQ